MTRQPAGPQIMALWPGLWALERAISGHATMTGNATFTPADDGNSLLYYEQGALALQDGKVLEACRSYRYTLQNDTIKCFFADGANKGELFHTLGHNSGHEAASLHHCGPDTYKLGYHFHSQEKFTLTCTVNGPRKDYEIHTLFTKCPLL